MGIGPCPGSVASAPRIQPQTASVLSPFRTSTQAGNFEKSTDPLGRTHAGRGGPVSGLLDTRPRTSHPVPNIGSSTATIKIFLTIPASEESRLCHPGARAVLAASASVRPAHQEERHRKKSRGADGEVWAGGRAHRAIFIAPAGQAVAEPPRPRA